MPTIYNLTPDLLRRIQSGELTIEQARAMAGSQNTNTQSQGSFASPANPGFGPPSAPSTSQQTLMSAIDPNKKTGYTSAFEVDARKQYDQRQQYYADNLQDQLRRGNYIEANHIKSLMDAYTGGAPKAEFEKNLASLKQADIGSEQPKAIENLISGNPTQTETQKQAINEAAAQKAQLDAQNKQLGDFRNQMYQQQFGAAPPEGGSLNLAQALSSTGGQLGQLNQFLGQQEGQTFNTQLKPLIQMALGAQGLSDSGAQVELQSKALAQLEQSRQQNMMQAALGAQGNINNLQRSDLLGGIGAAQQSLSGQFDLQRAGITMQFQQQLEQQRESLARELSRRQGGGGGGFMGALQGGIGGGLMGMALGGPPGALLGAGLGAFGGSQSSPYGQTSYGQGLMQTGGFFQSAFPGAGRSYSSETIYPSGGGVYQR